MSDAGVRSSTVRDLVFARLDRNPRGVAYTCLADDGAEDGRLTWVELDRRARAIGAWLSARRLQGERVVLLFPPGLDFVVTFFGCIYAGVTAVPAHALDPARLQRTLSRLLWMVEDCDPRLLLTTTCYWEADLAGVTAGTALANVDWRYVDSVSDDAGPWNMPDVDEDAIAVIQYTSGSIAAPKGVLVSNRNILANSEMIRDAHGYDGRQTIVSWVPLAHDWGLINSVIQPAYGGGQSVLMSPETFLRQPVQWLRAIARYEDVSSGGPNFAYDLCRRKVTPNQCEGLDLSGWNYAGVSAGPVRAETLREFSEAFGLYGFTADSFYAGYGLAEATLLVADSERRRSPRTLTLERRALQRHAVVAAPADDGAAVTLVGCGPPAAQQVVVVDPESGELRGSDEVGELWVAGAHVARGYWNRPAETEEVFHAHTSSGDGPFLRTGDLGFLHRGEVFVCGRLKDLIIVRGANIYPQDIEYTAERAHETLRRGCAAAFAVPAGSDEHLVVVQELRRGEDVDLAAAAGAIVAAVFREHGILADIVLIGAGAVPKTSSGKLQRNACRDAFINGTLDIVHRRDSGEGVGSTAPMVPPRTATEATLVAIWTDLLAIDQFSTVEAFVDACDSVAAAQGLARVAETFGIEVPLEQLFGDAGNIVELGRYLDKSARSPVS